MAGWRLALWAGLAAYVLASVLYLESFRVHREPGTVVLASTAELRSEAERLAAGFEASGRGRVVLAGSASGRGEDRPGDRREGAGLASVLSSGRADYVLAPDGGGDPAAGRNAVPSGLLGPPSAVPAPGVGAFYKATLLAVRFPSPHTDVTLAEARSLVADLQAGGRGPWPGAGLEVIGMAQRCAERQLLAVGGVYPTLATVAGEGLAAYPLATRVRLHVRRGPRGPLGLPAGLPLVRRWLRANDDAVRAFATWLGSDAARTVLYGTAREITLTAAGDVWFARHVGEVIDEKGLGYPFALVADRLRAADIAWCNLESPLGVAGTPLPGKLIWFRAKPETVQCLRLAGLDVVSLANNHILDYDSPSLVETLDILDQAGIAHCGAGRDEAEARRPTVIEVGPPKGRVKVAFLAYTEYSDPSLHWSFDHPRTFMAGEDLPGCNPLYLELVEEDIARARAGGADLVVVGYHWGRENEEYPTAYHPWNELPTIARETLALGACLVLGTHPHAVQGLEARGGGLIAYSLGNFVADQRLDTQKEGLLLEVQLGQTGVLSARLVPVALEGFRPRPMEGVRARELLQKVWRISLPYQEVPPAERQRTPTPGSRK